MLKQAFVTILAAWGIATGALVAQAETRVCHVCSEPIRGTFFETKGFVYHPEHFTCTQCSSPIIGSYTTYRGSNYHDSCFRDHVARKCAICGEVIGGQYLVDYWGNAYHARHRNDVISCDFCDRFITAELYEGGAQFDDGRSLCRICHASSIKRIGRARALMTGVGTELQRIGMDFREVDLDLHLIGLNEMQKLANHRSHDLRGFTDYHEEKNLFGKTRRRKIDIYLLYGMPRAEMIGTLAHELTHVWQFLQGRLRGDAAFSEGSCNFSSYWVLKQMAPGEEANFIIESMLRDKDRVYGEGFRRVKKYVEKNGLSDWLALMTERDPDLSK
jgi:hypothetical protein